jgi:hypothetical protein
VVEYLRGFSKIHFVLSVFALHLASHFGRSVSKHSYGYVSQPIDQTVSPATPQIPDPSCNMRAKAAPMHINRRFREIGSLCLR